MGLTLPAIAALAGLAVVLFAIERLRPLRRPRSRLLTRLLVNVVISTTAVAAAAAAVQPVASRMLSWTSEAGVGLLQLVDAPWPILGVAAFVLMDLSFYYWHLLNHYVPLLWRFHNVHHIDPDLDVSTAFRFHFGEVALSAGFRALQVLIIGPSLAAFVVYEIVFQANTLLHHSNVGQPIGLERLVNKILVTPRMHGIHHSQIRRENRSNFGVVFPWWDWIHRTLRLDVPQSEVTIGVAGYSLAEDNRLWRALAAPLCRQRDYWVAPDGTEPGRDSGAESKHSRLAE